MLIYCHNVCCQNVKLAVKKRKTGKFDCIDLFSSDHLKNACNEVFVHISFLLNMMLKHAAIPVQMLDYSYSISKECEEISECQ